MRIRFRRFALLLSSLVLLYVVPVVSALGSPLTLTVQSNRVPVGQSFQMTVSGGAALAPVGLLITHVDGQPTNLLGALDALDALGNITWTFRAPAFLAGAEFTFMAVSCSDPVNHRGVYSSNPTRVEFLPPVADLDPPAIALSATPGKLPVGQSSSLRLLAGDDTGVASVLVMVGGQTISMTETTPGTFDGVFTATTSGTLLATAQVQDLAGNLATTEVTILVTDPTLGGAPVASISSPAEDAVVATAVVVTGTADGPDFAFYELAYAARGSSNFVSIGTGDTPVVGGPLGSLDPTLMPNGLYVLRLRTTDLGGNEALASLGVQVDGEQKVGNFSLTFTDLQIPVSGMPVSVVRVYDSRDPATGDFGAGWKLELNTACAQENRAAGSDWFVTTSGFPFTTYTLQPAKEHLVTVTIGEDVHEFRVGFSPSSSFIVPLQFINAVTFTPLPGTNSTLTSNDTPFVILGSQPGPVEILDGNFELFDANQYVLTLQDGTRFAFAGSGRHAALQSLTDPNGNTLTVGPNGITHSAGAGVTFQRDTAGRITQITDPLAQTLQYSYDVLGNLKSFTSRTGDTSTYHYNSQHGLVSLRDPVGNVGVRQEYDDSGRLVAVVDAFGHRTSFLHDLGSSREVITDRRGGVTILTYDAQGQVVSRQEPDGSLFGFAYDAQGNVILETAPDGSSRSYSYDANGHLLSFIDENGNATTSTYSASGRPLTTTDANGDTISRTYDASGNVTSVTDPHGNTTLFAFDSQGNVTSRTDPGGGVTQMAYDSLGHLTSTTDALGNTTTFSYDANGNLVARTDPSGMMTTYQYDGNDQLIELTRDGAVTTFLYDAAGRPTGVTGAGGGSFQFEYDTAGNRTGTVLADGVTALRGYDEEGNLASETDPLGNVTSYVYDGNQRLVSTLHPDGTSEVSTYNVAGRLASRTGPAGDVTQYQYDATGNLTRITNALGGVTQRAFDPVGNLVSITDANGLMTTFDYETRDPDPASRRRIRTVFPDGTQTMTAFDAEGRPVSITDAAGNTTQVQYDAKGRKTMVLDALGGTTLFEYDHADHLTARVDARGNRTEFVHDGSGRLLQVLHPLGETEAFSYDSSGRLATRTNGNGDVISYDYDPRGMLAHVTLPGGLQEAYTYTADGLLASTQDAAGFTTYSYDAVTRRLVQVTEPDGRYVRYDHDSAGNRILVAHTPSAGGAEHVVLYSYDLLGRLIGVTDSSGTTSYTLDPMGNVVRVVSPSGVETLLEYDPLYRAIAVELRDSSSALIERYDYFRDARGNLLRELRADNSRIDYGYDALSRLVTEEHYSSGGVLLGDAAYSYDAVGNLVSRSGSLLGPMNYSFNANDQLVSAGARVFSYDGDGNLVAAGQAGNTTLYGYDARRRLTSYQAPTGTRTDYQYDARGVRTAAITAGVTTRFLVDRHSPTGYPEVVRETDGAGTTTSLQTFGRDLLSRTDAGGTSFLHHDALGSVRHLTDAAGAATDSYSYSGYGELLQHAGSSASPYRFTGERQDGESGLYYLRARSYDATLGRFLSRDPARGDDLLPLTTNPYLYAGGNPTNVVDRSGEFGVYFGIISYIRGILFGLYGGYAVGTAAAIIERVPTLVATLAVRNAKILLMFALAESSSYKYTRWFGDGSSGRSTHVFQGYDLIWDALHANITFNVTTDNVYAYVYPGGPLEIWIGQQFWPAPMIGVDSKAGTMIHELSHEVHGTDDHTYGFQNAQNLATNNPDLAIQNADNYEYYCEDGW